MTGKGSQKKQRNKTMIVAIIIIGMTLGIWLAIMTAMIILPILKFGIIFVLIIISILIPMCLFGLSIDVSKKEFTKKKK